MSRKRYVPKFKTIGQQTETNGNRAKYPEIAEWVDCIREVFPNAKVMGIYEKGYWKVKPPTNPL